MKFILFVCLALASAVSSHAITPYAMQYGKGLAKGLQIAADYVDDNAPDWETDYTQKSDVEFQLLAMEQTYTTGAIGSVAKGPRYDIGILAGIQAFIDRMNSVGSPVWFTGSDGVSDLNATRPRLAFAVSDWAAIGSFADRRPAQ